MTAFLVKHRTYGNEREKRPRLATIMCDLALQPYSLTGLKPIANKAVGHFVYVVETRKEGSHVTYWLGYKYRVSDVIVRTDTDFDYEKFKNIAASPPEGMYFREPVKIDDNNAREWLVHRYRMCEIQTDIIPTFDSMFSAGACTFE